MRVFLWNGQECPSCLFALLLTRHVDPFISWSSNITHLTLNIYPHFLCLPEQNICSSASSLPHIWGWSWTSDYLPRDGIRGMYPCTQFMLYRSLNPEPRVCLASSLPTEPHASGILSFINKKKHNRRQWRSWVLLTHLLNPCIHLPPPAKEHTIKIWSCQILENAQCLHCFGRAARVCLSFDNKWYV